MVGGGNGRIHMLLIAWRCGAVFEHDELKRHRQVCKRGIKPQVSGHEPQLSVEL